MPSVNRLSFPQVREELAPVVKQTAQPTADALGGGRSAAANFGAVEDAFQKIKQNADQVAVLDAQNRMAEWENAKLYDAKNGALNRKGRDALGIADEVFTDYEKMASEIEGSLSGRAQVEAFKRMRADKLNDIRRVVERHTANEMERYDDEQTQKGLELEFQNASKNFGDEELVIKSINRQSEMLFNFGKRKGKSQEWFDVENAKLISKNHMSVISSMLGSEAVGSDIAAESYFKKYKKSLLPEDATEINQRLEAATLLGASQRNADIIFEKYKNDETAGYDAAKKIKDPKVRDATERQLDVQFRRYKETVREVNEGAFKAAWNKLYLTKDLNSIKDVYTTFTHEQQKELINLYEKGAPNTDDPSTVSHLTNLFTNPELIDQAKQVKMSDYAGLLKPSTLASFETRLAKLRKDDPDELKRMNDEYVATVGIKPLLEKAGITDENEVFQFNQSLKRNLDILKKDKNRDLTSTEIDVEANKLLVKNVISTKESFPFWKAGLLGGPAGLLMNSLGMLPEQSVAKEIPLYKTKFEEIPLSIRNAIRDGLIKENRPTTEANILFVYQELIKDKKAKKQ